MLMQLRWGGSLEKSSDCLAGLPSKDQTNQMRRSPGPVPRSCEATVASDSAAVMTFALPPKCGKHFGAFCSAVFTVWHRENGAVSRRFQNISILEPTMKKS
jgi:hypothetical protein